MKTALELLGPDLDTLSREMAEVSDYHVGRVKHALALVAQRAREDMREDAARAVARHETGDPTAPVPPADVSRALIAAVDRVRGLPVKP